MGQSLKKGGFRALLVTQFLEAFNDNAVKVVVIFAAIDHFTAKGLGNAFAASAGALFILPFLLVSTYAGYLADRFSKRTIMISAKVAELAILLLGLVAFARMDMPWMLGILFLMGLHSAFFSPAKYGILPEILHKDDLPQGNGRMQMATYAAIILGQAAGGYLLHAFHSNILQVYYVFIAVAVLGIVTSLFISHVRPAATTRNIQWNFVRDAFATMSALRLERPVFLSIAGLVYFSFLGGIFQPNILMYARQMMGVDHASASILLVAVSLGIGIGSMMAGRFSDQKIELGLVPLGAIGLSVCSAVLGLVFHSYYAVFMTLFLLGLFGGFYIVPLNTLIQSQSKDDERGKIIATNNFFSFSAVLLASGFIYLLGEPLKANPAAIFVILGALTLAGTVYICRLLPYALVRLVVWLLAHTLYRIRVIDKGNVPEQGGGLLVSNHVSFVDAVLLVVTVQRPIRFVMNKDVYKTGILRWLFILGRAIPISPRDNPKDIVRALNVAREALNNKELVCIFPEGQLTRTGHMLKFHSGVEHIAKGLDCSILPVHLDRIWGSIFSWEGGKFLWKWPKLLPYPVTVTFGKPLPSSTKAFDIRQKVMELGAEAFGYRLEDKMTLPESFWREARKHPARRCMADSSGRKLNYGVSLVSAVALAKKLRPKLDQEKTIGILLPPSVAGALTNIAVSSLNKVPVNLNYTAGKEALASAVKQCAMEYVITSRAFLDKAGLQLSCQMIFVEDVIKAITKIEQAVALMMALIAPSPLSHRWIFGPKSHREHEKLATIMFTSGSTGEPKGVMLTHGNITSNLEGLYQVFNVRRDDVMVGVLPFFHSFGFTATLWFPIISGVGVVYHFNPLDAKVIGKIVGEHQGTVLMATPTFLSSYIRRCDPEQFRSLRMVTVGAEKLKGALAAEFQEKFGIEPMEGYGCTELSPVAAINLPDYDQQGIAQKAGKRGTIGLPLPGIAVRIVDPQTGAPKGANEDGLLLVKGPNVMRGYLNNPQKTAELIKDGWYMTGDIAHIDEDGFITITDRLSRFSKIAGEMVPHVKVEEVMHTILKSSEQVCVVSSVPDVKKGERLVVLCLPSVDIPRLCDSLKGSGLPNLWIPDAESFAPISSLPLLGTGKLDLAAVRAKAKEIFGHDGH